MYIRQTYHHGYVIIMMVLLLSLL